MTADVVPIGAARQRLPGMERRRAKRAPQRTVGMAVVHVDASRCPSCGTPIVPQGWAQPALFFFGGFGATTLFVRRRCGGCGWALPVEERSISPRAVGVMQS